VLIREHTAKVIDGEIVYAAWICGEQRADGAWGGWLEFHPVDPHQPTLRTDQETTQPNRDPKES
jgi:hypothetical protein